MLKRVLWAVPLVLALSAVSLEAHANFPKRRKPETAPEFDPKASGAALALLVGGALLLAERRRRHES